MTDRDDQSIDHELSGIAMAATHEHELTVSTNETEAALEAVRSRIAGGDLGGAPPSIDLRREGRRRSPLTLLAAAAAVIGMIGLGLVAVVGGDRTNDTILTPATGPAISGPVTTEGETATATTVADVAVTVPSSPEPTATQFVEQTIAVDAANPPPLIAPTVWRSVPIDAANVEPLAWVAISDDAVLVNQKGVQSITVLDREGDGRRDVAIEEDVSTITAGPFGVVYGFGDPVFAEDNAVVPSAFRFVGISLAEDGPVPAGQVFAVAEIDANTYLELPPYPFGTGDTGVIDRTRSIGDTVIEFSEGRDDAIGSLGVPVPRFAENEAGFADSASGRIEIPERGWAWNLDITRDPANNSGFAGPSAPAPTTGDRVMYFERIGAAESIADFARSAMPVVALLNPDGSGRWVRLPDEWDVVASDVWGTVLMRTTATDFEFALLDDVLAASDVEQSPPTSVAPVVDPGPSAGNETLVQPTAIVRTCAGEFTGCTQLASTQNGRIVGFDQVDNMLRVYNAEGTELQAEVPITEPLGSPYFWAVGPDDVAYVQTFEQGAGESGGELLAIPLIGSNAGSIVMRWTGLATSGDSSLIPRKAGLTSVACCGPKETRPSPDATIYRWVDRNGVTIESTAPSFDLNLGNAGNSLTRIDTQPDGSASFTRFTLPLAYQYPRDFPWITATDDGGALAYDQVPARSESVYVFVRFDADWPEGSFENGDVYYQQYPEFFRLPLLEPSGTVVVFDGGNDGQYVRHTLDEVATRGWPGRREIDLDTYVVTAPGLNDYITAEQPFWADDPELFAYQLSPALGDSEEVTVEYDESEAPAITITRTGLLDDSVSALRMVVTTERGSDGLLRFVSGDSTFQCSPNRGHQDFSTELCS